jgi:hypothetical protein
MAKIEENIVENRGEAKPYNGNRRLPYPKIKTDVVIAMRALLVIPNSSATWAAAGAIIAEEIGLINVKEETIIVAAHFRWYGQLENMISMSIWTN